MKKKTITDVDLKGKKVFLRCDFNVPLDKNQNITDKTRIVAALPTIKYLLENNCKVIATSHLGRPNGEVIKEMSLAPVAKELSNQLGMEVKFAEDVIGESAQELRKNIKEGEIILLENVRFHKEEIEDDPEFAKELAGDCDIFVNDAFGTAHRDHASVVGVAKYLPAVSGFLIKKEIEFLRNTIENPERPFMAIIGGAKVSDKIGVIDSLLDKVDTLLLGGGMAYTFFKAQGLEIGKSICEPDKCDLALELMEKAKQKGVKLVLPLDSRVAQEFSPDAESKVVSYDNIPSDWEGLDIGPKTIELFGEVLKDAKTVIWNGTLGVAEFEQFAVGTNSVAKILSELKDAVTVIGGGDSAAAVVKSGLSEKMTHISTGGGASLQFIEGKELPGVEALLD